MTIYVSIDIVIHHEAEASKGIYLIAALLPAALLSVPLAHIDTYQLLKAAIHPYHPSTAPCDIRCLTTTNPITFILS